MHTVERELISATDYKTRKKFDNRQDYLQSILNSVIKLGDEDFDNLTDEAAAWANAAIEAFNSKNEIPDFDEVDEADEGETSDEVIDPETGEVTEDDDEADEADPDEETDDEETSDMGETEPDPEDEEAEEVVAKPKKAAGREKAVKVPPPEKTAKKPRPAQFDSDATLDKWGCIEGSKNSKALAMFEKGATTSEVKKAIGGTYYNILAKCVENGHKMHKEGSLITIVHKSDAGKKSAPKAPPKAAAKAPAKAPAKKAVAKKKK